MEAVSGILFLVLIIFLVFLAILAILMPYFVYKIYGVTKEIRDAVLKISQGTVGVEIKHREVGL